jgi:hypothetical protein
MAQALGGIFTSMATDFNSGLLLVVMALACWPKATAHDNKSLDVEQPGGSAQPV